MIRTLPKFARTALVTGGALGLGEAISSRLSKDGYNVVIMDLPAVAEAGKSLAASIDGHFLPGDVSDPKSVEETIKKIVESHGSLDAVVNNAGVIGQMTPTGDYDLDEWKRIIDVNLSGTFYTLKYSLAQMAVQETGGAIVNMSR